MVTLVDFHSHIYANYTLEDCIRSAICNTNNAYKVAFLTERFDCSYFQQIPSLLQSNSELTITRTSSNYIEINNQLLIFRGRQFASIEGLEVLSLFCSPQMQEKLTAKEYCQSIIEQGGLVAFSWAFGKWSGKRGELIKELCLKYTDKQVIILDSKLRPKLLPLPKQMIELKNAGYKLFYGSDPLPLAWHQGNILSFGTSFDQDFNPELTDENMRDLILSPKSYASFGKRTTLIQFIIDQLALRF
jgi:hypothetical protein